NEQRTTLPNGLRDADLLSISWAEGSGHEGVTLMPLSMDEFRALPSHVVNESRMTTPVYYALDWELSGEGKGQVVWIPAPAVTIEARLVYRESIGAITVNDVKTEAENPDSQVVPVPDRMIELVALQAAKRLQMRNTK